MHVVKNWKKYVEEGICQVLADKYMDWHIANKYDSDDEFVQKFIPRCKAGLAQTNGFKKGIGCN